MRQRSSNNTGIVFATHDDQHDNSQLCWNNKTNGHQRSSAFRQAPKKGEKLVPKGGIPAEYSSINGITPNNKKNGGNFMVNGFERGNNHSNGHRDSTAATTSMPLASSATSKTPNTTTKGIMKQPAMPEGGSQQQRCKCCPYGFHIDLGFVKFAEDVATGREQIQNWSSPSKRARNIITSPVPSYAASPHPFLNISANNSEYGGGPEDSSFDQMNNSSSALLDSSVLSQKSTMDDPGSELDDLFSETPSEPPLYQAIMKKPIEKVPPSILKSRHQPPSDRFHSLRDSNGNANPVRSHSEIPFKNSMTMTTTPIYHQNLRNQSRGHHSSRQDQHRQPKIVQHPQQHYSTPSRRYTTLPPPLEKQSNPPPTIHFHSNGASSSLTLPYSIKTSTPLLTKRNDEFRTMPERTFVQHQKQNTSSTKPYYTAIAQSMAQLKKSAYMNGSLRASPVTTISNNRVPYRGGQFNAGSYTENSNSGNNKRPRVLSPEPIEGGLNNQPSFLRHSNLQSRSYFHGGGGALSTINGVGGTMPYRTTSLGGSGGGTSLFDGFASVRRQKMDQLTTANQFEATSELLRSLSPPRNTSTPNWSEVASNSDANYMFEPKFADEDAFYSAAPYRRSQTLSPTRLAMAIASSAKPIESNLMERKEISEKPVRLVTSMKEAQVQTLTRSLQSAGTQTLSAPKEKKKSVGVGTAPFVEKEPLKKAVMIDSFTVPDEALRIYPPRPKQQSIAVDTLDLLGTTKKIPPPPPPKPKEIDLSELRKRHLDLEFQFCLGHEPEHHPDDTPYILQESKFEEAMVPEKPKVTDRGCSPIQQLATSIEDARRKKMKTTGTETTKSSSNSVEIQTEIDNKTLLAQCAETQTEPAWFEEQLKQIAAEEKAQKRRSVDKITETDDSGAGDEFIHLMITCGKCERSSLEIDEGELSYEKIDEKEMEQGNCVVSKEETQHQKHQGSPHESSPQRSPPQNLPVIVEEELAMEPIKPATAVVETLETLLLKVEELPHIPPIPSPGTLPPTSFINNEKMLRMSEEFLDEEAEQLPEILVPNGEDSDRYSLDTDAQTVIMVQNRASGLQDDDDEELEGDRAESRTVDPTRVEAVRKLLTEEQRSSPFQRGAVVYRSYKLAKGKGNDLDYIAERHTNPSETFGEPSTPCSSNGSTKKALKEMVHLKKTFSSAFSAPEPIPAKIPRPKYAKYSPNAEHAETPDEAEEANDRLTPLRSEMRPLTSWGSPSRLNRVPHIFFKNSSSSANASHEFAALEEEDDDELMAITSGNYRHAGDTGEFLDDDECDVSSSSSDGTRTYEMSEHEECSAIRFENGEVELSTPLRDALEMINNQLMEGTPGGHSADWAFKYTQHEWFKLATKRNANAELVEEFLDVLETFSQRLLEQIVNMQDQNGNMALHYAVSHENYDVISVLLDSKVCRLDEMNKAGYSPVMLGALCELKNETEIAIIQRLFQMGDVNAKALEHKQTALMLAASHGRVETTKLLLKCGAEVNIQDIEGSTSLMCAAEHGQKDIVKILLKQPNIDASLTDCDNQTALSIAVENNHRDIGVLIYAHLNFSRLEHNDNSVAV